MDPPNSVGAVQGPTDALITLFLDHLTQRHLGVAVRTRVDALRVLKIEAGDSARCPDFFNEIARALSDDTAERAADA